MIENASIVVFDKDNQSFIGQVRFLFGSDSCLVFQPADRYNGEPVDKPFVMVQLESIQPAPPEEATIYWLKTSK